MYFKTSFGHRVCKFENTRPFVCNGLIALLKYVFRSAKRPLHVVSAFLTRQTTLFQKSSSVHNRERLAIVLSRGMYFKTSFGHRVCKFENTRPFVCNGLIALLKYVFRSAKRPLHVVSAFLTRQTTFRNIQGSMAELRIEMQINPRTNESLYS